MTKLLDEQNTAIEKLTTEQEKVTAALSKIADTAGNVARHKSDNEKLADELARAKAHIDQLKADISTADIRRDELVANNGEAIGEMRATARRHEEENIGLKAQIAELRHQHAGQVEPREQPLPLSRRGALSFPATIPRRLLATASPGNPMPLPVGTPHIRPPRRVTLMVTPSETPSGGAAARPLRKRTARRVGQS